jgi:hypothetical protein
MPSYDEEYWVVRNPLVASLLLILVVTGASLHAGSASEQDTIHSCGYIDYGDYEPKEPRSLQSLPKAIRTRVISHLTARLGPDIYSRLHFTGGQIVDIPRLYKVEPEAREYDWVIPTYLLHFEIEFGADPAERYCAGISLDANGEVIDDIALPKTADAPAKIAVVSKAKALEIAATHDVPVDRASAELAYAPAFDCLEWLVSFKVEEHLSTFRGQVLHLNAADPSKFRWSGFVGDY